MDTPRHNLGVLTEKQKRFAFEIFRDPNRNATAAYRRAGYSMASTGAPAALLSHPEVQAAINELEETAALVATLDKNFVLKHWMQLASANPADLVQTLSFPCSKCWEIVEDEDARAALDDPNPGCKLCRGLGLSVTNITPTAKIPERSKILFAGAHQTKDGIKIAMRDQAEAIKNLANYLGMERKISEISGPGGGPIALGVVRTADQMSEEELALIIAGEVPLLLGDGA